MEKGFIIESQLKLTYEVYNKSYEQRLDDKKLCVTLWLAVIGFVATKPGLSMAAVAFFVFCPIVMFWFLDGARAVYTQLWAARIVQLEALLLQTDPDVNEIRPLLFLSGREHTFRQKLKALLRALFVMESVYLFYLFMAIVAMGYLLVYPHFAWIPSR